MNERYLVSLLAARQPAHIAEMLHLQAHSVCDLHTAWQLL
jgi:hypothetical protein